MTLTFANLAETADLRRPVRRRCASTVRVDGARRTVPAWRRALRERLLEGDHSSESFNMVKPRSTLSAVLSHEMADVVGQAAEGGRDPIMVTVIYARLQRGTPCRTPGSPQGQQCSRDAEVNLG